MPSTNPIFNLRAGFLVRLPLPVWLGLTTAVLIGVGLWIGMRYTSSGAGEGNTLAPVRVQQQNFSTLNELRSFDASQIIFAKDGNSLLAVGNELLDQCVGMIRLSDRGNTIRRFGRHREMVTTVALSPDEKFVLSGCADGSICLWSTISFDRIRSLDRHADRVSQVAFSPDGSICASTGYDKTLRIWRVFDGVELHECKTPDVEQNLIFTPNGERVVTCGWAAGVRVWDAKRGVRVGEFGTAAGVVTCLAASEQGERICGGGHGTVRVWNVATGSLDYEFADDITTIYSVAISPEGRRVAGGGRSGRFLVWDLPNQQLLKNVKLDGHITGVAYSADGRELAVCVGGQRIHRLNAD